MKGRLVVVVLLLLTTAVAQDRDPSSGKGSIYGLAFDHDGRPAKGVGLRPFRWRSLLLTLPSVRTNDKGEFHFENLPWGRYSVHSDDEDAGYADYLIGAPDDRHPSEVEITREHPKAELIVYLPPKAGFAQIHLTNRLTKATISGMHVDVMAVEKPESPLFSTTRKCCSDEIVLVPPDKDLLLHVTANGFHEWNESVGKGKLIRLASGERIKFNAQLDPVP